MKTIPDPLKAHLAQDVTTLCTCINVVRQDGQSYCFTDHDQPIVVNNQTFLPNFSYARASIPTGLSLEVDSVDITGIMLGSDADAGLLAQIAITREEIDVGLYDFAVVYMFLVNYVDPTMGTVPLRRGWIGEIESNEDDTFKCEIRGLSQVFAYRVSKPYQPECRADLGDAQCGISLSPPLWAANNGYQIGDRVLGHISAADNFVQLSINNPSFETPLTISPGPAPGWISYGDDLISGWSQETAGPFSMTPVDGNFMIAHVPIAALKSWAFGMYQDIDLVHSAGFTTTQLDTGLCRLIASAWGGSPLGGTTYRIRFYALDANNNTIKTLFDSGAQHTVDSKLVQWGCNNVNLPVGTRFVRFDLWSGKTQTDTVGAFFDQVIGYVNLPDGTMGSALQFGGVAFRCTQTGITGVTEPAFTNVIGDTFSDGTLEWVCVPSPKETATITTLVDDKNFKSTGHVQTADFYDHGIVTWETGPNAGRSQEVQLWTGGIMTLIFRPFFPMVLGDRFTVFPGCQKTIEDCQDKFDNIINFQGEPMVPGQDRYMYVPGSQTG